MEIIRYFMMDYEDSEQYVPRDAINEAMRQSVKACPKPKIRSPFRQLSSHLLLTLPTLAHKTPHQIPVVLVSGRMSFTLFPHRYCEYRQLRVT
jgi:hypothetical protein